MIKKYMPLLFSCTFLIFQLTAQDKIPIEFGRVAPEDFNISNFKVDTTNGGVIIADVGSSSFKGNNKGWFSLIYKHQRRLKIINKNGFDLANVEIPLYFKDNGEEKIEQLNKLLPNFCTESWLI